jgi:cytochrome c-type biogenesis protein CcmE
MTTGKKMAIGGAILAGITIFMAYRGASADWQYYLTADECVAERTSLLGRRLRVSGRIAAGTLKRERDRSMVTFALDAGGASLKVVCTGTMPDNLAEGMAVLVEGRLDDNGLLRGDKVLTRCASKYESRLPPSATQSPPDIGQQREAAGATRSRLESTSKPKDAP